MKNLMFLIAIASLLFSYSAVAQEVEVVGQGTHPKQKKYHNFIGYGNGNEVRNDHRILAVFKEGELIKKVKLSTQHKQRRFIGAEDYIYYFYIEGNPKREGAIAYMEKRDFDFNLVGQRVQVMDLHASKGVAFRIDYKAFKVEYNKKFNRFLVSFVVQKEDEDNSYIKASLVDTGGNTLNSFAYAVNEGKILELNDSGFRILENGDAMVAFVIFDSADSYKRVVIGIAVVYIPGDGSDLVALPVEPELEQMTEVGITSFIDKDGNVYYAVLSSKQKDDNSILTLYKFNVKNQEYTKNNYKIKLKDYLKFPMYQGFYLNEVYTDENNVKYVDLTIGSSKQRHLILKLDEKDNLVWISALEKLGYDHPNAMSSDGDLSFIDNEGDLVYIFNSPINRVKEGVYYPVDGSMLNTLKAGGFITLKARFDQYSGEVTYEHLKIDGKETVDLVIGEAQETDQNGVYKVQLKLGENKKDFKVAVIDFN